LTVLVTGSAGFIGHHLTARLLSDGHEVIGVDNYSPYYDVGLKHARTARLRDRAGFTEHRIDIATPGALAEIFADVRPATVFHMAAQPGVRFSLEQPHTYVTSNLVGFANLIEAARSHPPAHLIYASSSSVYGANTALPSSEANPAEHPLTLYAASKKANEAMAHAYAHLFDLPMTGVRFFTVYGEWGRPDMAFFSFTRAILAGDTITANNRGEMSRDFTYIADVVEALVRLMDHPPAPDADWSSDTPTPATSGVAPHRILNIGNGRPVPLMRYLELLQQALGRKTEIALGPMQPGEARDTFADTSALEALTGFTPQTPVETGIANFVTWYIEHYGTTQRS